MSRPRNRRRRVRIPAARTAEGTRRDLQKDDPDNPFSEGEREGKQDLKEGKRSSDNFSGARHSSSWIVFVSVGVITLSLLLVTLLHHGTRRLFLPSAPLPPSLVNKARNAAASLEDKGIMRQGLNEAKDDQETQLLSPPEKQQYLEDGFLVLRGLLSDDLIKILREINSHIFEHPSILVSNANQTNFCGFSLHNHLLIPEWREIAYRLPMAQIAAELMDTDLVLYSQDIFHATSHHCGNKSVGAAHSDMNQSPYSIEKKQNWGDNMMVAWVALDSLEEITMDLFPGSHSDFDRDQMVYNAENEGERKHEYKSGAFTSDEYCEWWEEVERADRYSYANSGSSETITLQPGDVALFQGLTWHQVRKTSHCTLHSCRRVTMRYVDGENTKMRSDIPMSPWPVVQTLGLKKGEMLASTLPVVYGPHIAAAVDDEENYEHEHERQHEEKKKMKLIRYNLLEGYEGRPFLPSLSDWGPLFGKLGGLLWRKVIGGSGPNAFATMQLINQCPHRRKINEEIDQEIRAGQEEVRSRQRR